MEHVIVVLGPCINHRNAFYDLAQGDAAAVVAYAYRVVFYGNVDLFAMPHDKFVNGVVNDLFEQDVNPVIRI